MPPAANIMIAAVATGASDKNRKPSTPQIGPISAQTERIDKTLKTPIWP